MKFACTAHQVLAAPSPAAITSRMMGWNASRVARNARTAGGRHEAHRICPLPHGPPLPEDRGRRAKDPGTDKRRSDALRFRPVAKNGIAEVHCPGPTKQPGSAEEDQICQNVGAIG